MNSNRVAMPKENIVTNEGIYHTKRVRKGKAKRNMVRNFNANRVFQLFHEGSESEFDFLSFIYPSLSDIFSNIFFSTH